MHPKSVTTLTPQRISFAGGGTDFEDYYKEHEGAVLCSTIDKYIYVTVKRHSPLFNESYRLSYYDTEHVNTLDEIKNDIARECLKLVPLEPPLHISTSADLPASSGLGSSSSFAVGLLHALHTMKGENISSTQLAEEACHVEISMLKKPIGKQDQYAVAFGGLNFLKFEKNNRVSIDHIWEPKGGSEFLFNDLMLFWTGLQRNAEDILSEQKGKIDKSLDSLNKIKILAYDLKDLILKVNNSSEEIGKILDKNWNLKKGLSSNITNNFIDNCYLKALKCGAYGGKIAGAGGGGFLMIFADKNYKNQIINELPELIYTPIQFEPKGTRLLSLVN